MTRKTKIIILIVFGGLFLIYKMGETFSPGSYGHAEGYQLNYSQEKVIEAINKLKDANKDLVVPKAKIQNSGQCDLTDGKEKETDHWYKFYFYDKVNNQILLTWVRPTGPKTTTFAFVSVNDGLELGRWKDINDDLGFFESRKLKSSFEETILKKVRSNLGDE